MTPGQFLQRLRTAATSPFTLKGKPDGLLLAFEVFVMVALAVSYYFAIRPYGVYSDKWSLNTFAAYAQKNTLPDQPELFEAWKGRLGGMLLTGALYDHSVRENDLPTQANERFNDIFALYHAAGLLLLFLAITCALRNSLLINLGIFGGLIYNLSPANGPNFYPWDMPAALFFTLAVILHQRRQPILMLVVCCTGYFFKETVLAAAILLFFNQDWSWKKKIPAFCAAVALCLIGKKLLLGGMHLNNNAVLAMANAHSLTGLLNWTFLDRNVLTLLSTNLNHVIFANAGTLLVMLLLVGNKRFQQYSILIWLFFIAQMLYGTVKEFRIFGEILPLSWILLLGYWRDWQFSRASTPHPDVVPDTAWAPRAPRAAFSALVVLLVALTLVTVAWRYTVMAEFRDPGRPARVFNQAQVKAQANDLQAEFELGKLYLHGQGTATNLTTACVWFAKSAKGGNAAAALLLAQTLDQSHQWSDAINAYYITLRLDTNSTTAMNGLARIRAAAADAKLRNANEAIRLAEHACALTDYKEAVLLETLAIAYANAGRYDDAILTNDRAHDKARQNQFLTTLDETTLLTMFFKNHQPYHEPPDP